MILITKEASIKITKFNSPKVMASCSRLEIFGHKENVQTFNLKNVSATGNLAITCIQNEYIVKDKNRTLFQNCEINATNGIRTGFHQSFSETFYA